ncbi:glycosyltransferase family 4 protein [Paenibacillus radicis (ex Xue et al. 2023)]|uniref:Glycosyltransferase family 4 protein n=1 Tax=Paenibacillus radicis (ex Xue et al. 2023) TaxID=2972489 RepID=A0ABT1YUZ7_9BACL|nr:glycosyltransferase family 4 protein [Paenibacillus radicis (ex Xue et al. 2023)]MCR8636757.1 glycosyltransferase family 4 protein [Paenibacillus radicis (ex Xue et al. 2023)]
MTPYKVVWKGPVERASGLGIASREYVYALKRLGVDVTVGAARNRLFHDGSNRKRKILIYHHSPNTINMSKERKAYDRIILNTVWETTKIPRRWLANINKFDAVCVPSIQNKHAMRNSGVRVPIFIVPHGVHSQTYNPSNKKLSIPEAKGKFIFVSVFGFQHRKNPEALLRAYWEAFSASDNVLLVIKTNGYAAYENEAWIKNRIKNYKSRLGIRKATAPVKVIGRHVSSKQLRGIYTLGDAFVLPTRGEGVGLPFLESLSSGVPVIATGWGGHKDFLTHRNSFLISYKLRNPASSMNSRHSISRQFRGLFAEKGQQWAEVDLSSLKKQMRAAYQNPHLCKQKGRQGRQDALKLTWDRAGYALKQAVEKVIQSKKGL